MALGIHVIPSIMLGGERKEGNLPDMCSVCVRRMILGNKSDTEPTVVRRTQ